MNKNDTLAAYSDFTKWCRDNPHLDLDSRPHSHGGPMGDGGYISDEKTRVAFAAWRAATEADRQQRGEPDYQISACYFPQVGEVELSWERVCDGEVAHLTFAATPNQGKRLVEVIDPCVYYPATLQPAEPTPAQIRRARLRADPVKAAALDRAKERIAADLANSTEPVKCQDPSMGEHACTDRQQCWVPCGELGKSAEHATVAELVKVPSDDDVMSLASKHEAHGDVWADAEYRFAERDVLKFAHALLARYGSKS